MYKTSKEMMEHLIENNKLCVSGKCNAWVAYIGDSLLSSPFNHLIDTLLGADWPVGGDRGTMNKTTYHVDRRVCCHSNPLETLNVEPLGLNCTFTRAFGTAAFVRRFFRDNARDTNGLGNVCITWQWNRLADAELRNHIANYTGVYEQGPTLFDDAVLAPHMIVVDPGLHSIMSNVSRTDYTIGMKLLMSHMSHTVATQRNLAIAPTRFVVHDITSVIDADRPEGKENELNQTMVVEFNAPLQNLLRDMLAVPETREWLRVVPANRLTALGHKHGLVRALGDGVHYWGGYSTIVVGLHMYFMDPHAAASFCGR
jgi:hypothetical protein